MYKKARGRPCAGPALIPLLGSLLLAACGGQPERDGPPDHDVDPGRVPPVVPRVEPLSKYGNPRSYTVLGRRYRVLRSSNGFVERGIASWYGKKFHGRRTSSGERYDMYGMTAAHKTLPLPTYVRVTNLENRRTVVLRVNDRGPFHDNRVIDLTYTAARQLGIVSRGTGYVEVRALEPDTRLASAEEPPPSAPEPPPAATPAEVTLYLQVGAFTVQSNARRLHDQLQALVGPISTVQPVTTNGRRVYRVRLGPLAGVAHADRLTESLLAMGLETPQVILE